MPYVYQDDFYELSLTLSPSLPPLFFYITILTAFPWYCYTQQQKVPDYNFYFKTEQKQHYSRLFATHMNQSVFLIHSNGKGFHTLDCMTFILILFIFLPHKLFTALIFFVKALKQQRAAKISRSNQKPAPYHAYYFYSGERINKNI